MELEGDLQRMLTYRSVPSTATSFTTPSVSGYPLATEADKLRRHAESSKRHPTVHPVQTRPAAKTPALLGSRHPSSSGFWPPCAPQIRWARSAPQRPVISELHRLIRTASEDGKLVFKRLQTHFICTYCAGEFNAETMRFHWCPPAVTPQSIKPHGYCQICTVCLDALREVTVGLPMQCSNCWQPVKFARLASYPAYCEGAWRFTSDWPTVDEWKCETPRGNRLVDFRNLIRRMPQYVAAMARLEECFPGMDEIAWDEETRSAVLKARLAMLPVSSTPTPESVLAMVNLTWTWRVINALWNQRPRCRVPCEVRWGYVEDPLGLKVIHPVYPGDSLAELWQGLHRQIPGLRKSVPGSESVARHSDVSLRPYTQWRLDPPLFLPEKKYAPAVFKHQPSPPHEYLVDPKGFAAYRHEPDAPGVYDMAERSRRGKGKHAIAAQHADADLPSGKRSRGDSPRNKGKSRARDTSRGPSRAPAPMSGNKGGQGPPLPSYAEMTHQVDTSVSSTWQSGAPPPAHYAHAVPPHYASYAAPPYGQQVAYAPYVPPYAQYAAPSQHTQYAGSSQMPPPAHTHYAGHPPYPPVVEQGYQQPPPAFSSGNAPPPQRIWQHAEGCRPTEWVSHQPQDPGPGGGQGGYTAPGAAPHTGSQGPQAPPAAYPPLPQSAPPGYSASKLASPAFEAFLARNQTRARFRALPAPRTSPAPTWVTTHRPYTPSLYDKAVSPRSRSPPSPPRADPSGWKGRGRPAPEPTLHHRRDSGLSPFAISSEKEPRNHPDISPSTPSATEVEKPTTLGKVSEEPSSHAPDPRLLSPPLAPIVAPPRPVSTSTTPGDSTNTQLRKGDDVKTTALKNPPSLSDRRISFVEKALWKIWSGVLPDLKSHCYAYMQDLTEPEWCTDWVTRVRNIGYDWETEDADWKPSGGFDPVPVRRARFVDNKTWALRKAKKPTRQDWMDLIQRPSERTMAERRKAPAYTWLVDDRAVPVWDYSGTFPCPPLLPIPPADQRYTAPGTALYPVSTVNPDEVCPIGGRQTIPPEADEAALDDERPSQHWSPQPLHHTWNEGLPEYFGLPAKVLPGQRDALQWCWLRPHPWLLKRYYAENAIMRLTLGDRPSSYPNKPKEVPKACGKGGALFHQSHSIWQWNDDPRYHPVVANYRRIADFLDSDPARVPTLWGPAIAEAEAPDAYMQAEEADIPRPYILSDLQETIIDVTIRNMLYAKKVIVALLYVNFLTDTHEMGIRGKPQLIFAEMTLISPWDRKTWRIQGSRKASTTELKSVCRLREDLMWYDHGLHYFPPTDVRSISQADIKPTFVQAWEKCVMQARLPKDGTCVLALPDMQTENTLRRYIGEQYTISCLQVDCLCPPSPQSLPPRVFGPYVTQACGQEHRTCDAFYTWRNPRQSRRSPWLEWCHICSQSAASWQWGWLHKWYGPLMHAKWNTELHPEHPHTNPDGTYALKDHLIRLQTFGLVRRLLWRVWWGYQSQDDWEHRFWILSEERDRFPPSSS